MSGSNEESALKSTVKKTISGGVGGMSLVLAGHPLDTIKCVCVCVPFFCLCLDLSY